MGLILEVMVDRMAGSTQEMAEMEDIGQTTTKIMVDTIQGAMAEMEDITLIITVETEDITPATMVEMEGITQETMVKMVDFTREIMVGTVDIGLVSPEIDQYDNRDSRGIHIKPCVCIPVNLLIITSVILCDISYATLTSVINVGK